MLLIDADLLTSECRVRDWLYGVSNTEPEPGVSAEPQTEAERLRVIYNMITVPREEGGADITPNHGEWKNVDAIFSLHDEEMNNRCLREWSKKTFLSTEDLDQIRGRFGESVCGISRLARITAIMLTADRHNRWLSISPSCNHISDSWSSLLCSVSRVG